MKRMVAVIALLCAAMSADATAATCIPVNGLTFEKVGYSTLMMIQNGKNYGLLKIYWSAIPDNFSVRFFTPTVCDDGSGNSKFQINGKLEQVENIQVFK